MTGRLVADEGGCVALKTSDGAIVPVSAPWGSQLLDRGMTVSLSGLGEFALGDEVDLPGEVRLEDRDSPPNLHWWGCMGREDVVMVAVVDD
jgi:hypothetical protein